MIGPLRILAAIFYMLICLNGCATRDIVLKREAIEAHSGYRYKVVDPKEDGLYVLASPKGGSPLEEIQGSVVNFYINGQRFRCEIPNNATRSNWLWSEHGIPYSYIIASWSAEHFPGFEFPVLNEGDEVRVVAQSEKIVRLWFYTL